MVIGVIGMSLKNVHSRAAEVVQKDNVVIVTIQLRCIMVVNVWDRMKNLSVVMKAKSAKVC